jgi:transcriptional regulator with XRE-family HTH domain
MSEPYTQSGLLQLARIVKQARGKHSYREFEKISGVSHSTIRRLERCQVKNPEKSTWQKIAPHTDYCTEELIAIGEQKEKAEIREYRTAEEALPVIEQLSNKEAARLAQMIVGRLAKLSVRLQDDPPPDDGLFLQVQLMNKDCLAETLRDMADRLSNDSSQNS